MKRLGIDLDGVLYDWDKTAHYMLAMRRGLMFREDLPWDFTQHWRGIPREEWDWLWEPENIDPMFRHGHLYRGAIEFVYSLAELGELAVVTKRPKSAARVTRQWLDFHWGEPNKPSPFSDIYIIGDSDKTSVPPFDWFLDDNVDNLRALAITHKTYAVLMDRPWNHGVISGYYDKRVRDFDEALESARRRIR